MIVKILKHPFLYIIVFFIIVSGVTVFGRYSPSLDIGGINNEPRLFSVELKDDGFYPAELTIKVGDSITFSTVSGEDFWPASDPHPTHEFLGGFDPGRIISSDESWTYTFNQSGTWRYHDHLNVSFRGKVTVSKQSEGFFTRDNSLKEECDGLCFDERIRETVRKKGIDAAYSLFQETFEAGTLPRSCHWTAHQIGEEAYELFKNGKEFPITEATSHCGYGFYHGFLEGLLRENPDIEYVLSFCKRVEAELGDMGLQNCFHGIGHGFTEDPPDPEVWGNFEAMIKPGIKVCEFLFKNSFRNLNLCLTGVFTVPAGFAANGEFDLSIDPEDPFAFCRTQPYRYRKACYGEFAPKLDTILEWDLSRLPQYVDGILDDKTKRLVVWVVPSVMMARDILKDDHTNYILGCRENFEGRLREICFAGTVFGFFAHGIPGEEYRKVLSFCKAEIFLGDEQALCYSESLRQMRVLYTPQKVTQICEFVPESYKAYCTGTLLTPPYDDPSFDSV